MIDTSEQSKSQYRLRRVGRPATKSSVKDIMKLKKDVTRFGRHSGNDFYLDSANLECFISRWHAEIHRVLQNGKIHFVLRDTSLNGTYVNNYRVLGNHRLKVGEIICFGHTNGKNLKPGDYAPQTDSEFEFIFEEYTQDEAEDTEHNELQSENQVHHDVVDSTTDVHSLSSHHASLAQSNARSPDVAQSTFTYGIGSSKPESTASPSTVKSSSSGTSSPVMQDISNKRVPASSSVTGLIPLDQYAAQSSNGQAPSTPCNITVHVTQNIMSPALTQQQQISATSPQVSHHVEITKEERRLSELPDTKAVYRSPTLLAHLKSSQPPAKSVVRKRKSLDTSQTGSKKKFRASFPKKPRRRSSMVEYNEDDDDGDDDESDEDESWHYDGEKCDAPHCKRPKTKKVSWVQCDDCDDWYHTQCAGCRYNKVKQANAEFHCGCLEKS